MADNGAGDWTQQKAQRIERERLKHLHRVRQRRREEQLADDAREKTKHHKFVQLSSEPSDASARLRFCSRVRAPAFGTDAGTPPAAMRGLRALAINVEID